MSRDSIRQRVAAAQVDQHDDSCEDASWCRHMTERTYPRNVAALMDHARQDIPALLGALDAAERSLRHAEHLECQFVWCKEFRAALAALAALP